MSPMKESDDDYIQHSVEQDALEPPNTDSCAQGCAIEWIGDGSCDSSCDTAECGYDFGDCRAIGKNKLFRGKYQQSEDAILMPCPYHPRKRWCAFRIELPKHYVERVSNTTVHFDPRRVRKALIVPQYSSLMVLIENRKDKTGQTVSISMTNTKTEKIVIKVVDETHASQTLDEDDDTDSSTVDDEEIQMQQLDVYGKSLFATRMMLKRHFGFGFNLNSRVPAHMPHLFDTRLLRRLRETFPEQFDATSKEKFRSEADIQLSYLYFTFLMAETEQLPEKTVVWSHVDIDGDGCLNENEFRLLAAMILSEDAFYVSGTIEFGDDDDLEDEEPITISADILLKVYDKLWNAGGAFSSLRHRCISLDLVMRDTKAFGALSRSVLKTLQRTLPRYHLVDADDTVTFAMLRDEPRAVHKSLDSLRSRPTKFFCINDDTSESQSPKQSALVDKALRSFLETWYPKASKYERSDLSQ